MARLVFGMMQSLDGYVAGVAGGPELPIPGPALHRHFNDHVRGLAGCLYGRRIYQLMRYWEEDRPDWGAIEQDYAAAWRAQPKWVVSRSLKSVGPNATLVSGDVEAFVRRLKAQVEGDIDVAGPELAASLTDRGLIDESTGSTSARWSSAGESPTSPGRGRRCASSATTRSRRTPSG